MKLRDDDRVDREYLERLQELIDETEESGRNYEKEIAKISLKEKYKIQELSGVGLLKIENIAIYMKNNKVRNTYELIDHDLTDITGIGEDVAKAIKSRINLYKDNIERFR